MPAWQYTDERAQIRELYDPESPFAGPDWRWHRCHLKVPASDRRTEDECCRRLRAFLAEKSRPRSVNRPPDPVLTQAISLYCGDPIKKALVEALVLTRRSDDQIAHHTGIPPEVVELFAKLFFDVRAKINCFGWIRAHAIRMPTQEGWPEDDYGLFWRDVGYHGGPLMLEPFIDPPLVELVRRYGLRGYLRPESTLHFQGRRKVVLRLTPVNQSRGDARKLRYLSRGCDTIRASETALAQLRVLQQILDARHRGCPPLSGDQYALHISP